MKRSLRRSATKRQQKRQAADRLAIEYVAIDSLAPNSDNPRIHSIAQIDGIAESISTFGFALPLLVDEHDRLIAGHGRLAAAKKLDIRRIPIIRLMHLSEPQAKALMLADNKLTDRSGWDDAKLAVILKDLHDNAIDFRIEAAGFERPEIDLRIQALLPPDDIDAIDEVPSLNRVPVSRPGDRWIVGDHVLVCGNALEAQSYVDLLAGAKASAVLTDPPFNVRVQGHVGGRGRTKHQEFPMASGELTSEDFQRFLGDAFAHMTAHCEPGATFFSCMDWRHMREIQAAIDGVDCELLNLCIWVKSNGGMGSLYRSQHELVFVFGRRGEKRVNNVQLGRFGRNRTNVWNYPGMGSFARRGRVRALDLHPTAKPIAMIADAMLDVTQRGDIVLDPFCGSGATILAVERTGRRAYAVELDPLHVDTAIQRWQRLTGRNAVDEGGKTFDQIGEERRLLGAGT